MKFDVILAPAAKADLQSIGLFIAQDNAAKALKWMDLLEERAHSLSTMPMRGRRYKKQYRMLTVENGYQIFYRVDQSKKVVIIVHFYMPYHHYDEDLKYL